MRTHLIPTVGYSSSYVTMWLLKLKGLKESTSAELTVNNLFFCWMSPKVLFLLCLLFIFIDRIISCNHFN